MEIKVKSLYLKVSPFKVRPTLHGLLGQNAQKAYVSLRFTNKKGAGFMAGLLKSAIAIGKENDLDLEKLYIKSVYCNEGPRLKRRQIKARGRSDAITKRMCHLNLIISDTAIEKKVEPDKKIKVQPTKGKNGTKS